MLDAIITLTFTLIGLAIVAFCFAIAISEVQEKGKAFFACVVVLFGLVVYSMGLISITARVVGGGVEVEEMEK